MKTLKLETTKKFKHYGDKVKSLSIHPDKPLLAAAHYNGKLSIFNYDTQTIVKTLEVSDKPLRCVIWVPGDRLFTAGDDIKIKAFNFHTTDKLCEFEGHKDFLRKIIFNPISSHLLSCSDDKTIIQWISSGHTFIKNQQWTEHRHFVMDIKFNPHDNETFASASLDGTIKLWHMKSSNSNGTLKGHKSGVNCIDFYKGDRPLLISGGDDYEVIVWDLSSKAILRRLKHHENNVIDLIFMEKLPLFSSISEDGKINLYNLKNFEFAFDLVHFMNKGWSLATKGNLLAAGYDEGCIAVQIGRDLPCASAAKGKMIFIKNSEVFSTNLKAVVAKKYANMEVIEPDYKELGTLDIFPSKSLYSDNGQLVAFIDNNEYIIYKALSFKQVLFGNAKDLVWGVNGVFAILDQLNEIVIQTSSGEIVKTLKFDFYITEIFGGSYLGISNGDFILFYTWEGQCVGKIDVEAKDVYWYGDEFIVKGSNVLYKLSLNPKSKEKLFDLHYEIEDTLQSGYWLKNLFFYTTESLKFKVALQGKGYILATFGENNMILDYLLNHERFFFFDSNSNVRSYNVSSKLVNILEQVEKHGFENIDISTTQALTEEERDFIAKILQQNDQLELAYNTVSNTRTKFDLGIKLGYLEQTVQFCEELCEPIYWKKLGDLALLTGDFEIAQRAFWACDDLNSLLLLGSSICDKEMLLKVAEASQKSKHYSVAFTSYWICGDLKGCINSLVESEKFGNALIFAKNYCPSEINPIMDRWRLYVKKRACLDRLANPNDYPEQYGELEFLEKIEKVIKNVSDDFNIPSQNYLKLQEKLNELDFYKIAKEQGIDALREQLYEIYKSLKEIQEEELEQEIDEENVSESEEEPEEADPEYKEQDEDTEAWGDVEVLDEG